MKEKVISFLSNKWIVITLCIIAYYLMYLNVRKSHRIVHWQNKGMPIGHEVRARTHMFHGMLAEMAGNVQGNAILVPLAKAYDDSYKIYNFVFYPLRKAEEAYWEMGDD